MDYQSWIGLDLGMGSEPTALCAIRRESFDGRDPKKSPVYHVEHLHRFPPGTPYSEVAETIFEWKQRREYQHTPVIVDIGGVGQSVADLVMECLIGRVEGKYLRVRLIAAPQPGPDVGIEGLFPVPFVELVGTFQVLLQTRRLMIPPSLELAQTLGTELSAFRMRPRPKPADGDPWRERVNDDLMFAVGIVLWTGERVLNLERKRWNEEIEERERRKRAQIDRAMQMWRFGW